METTNTTYGNNVGHYDVQHHDADPFYGQQTSFPLEADNFRAQCQPAIIAIERSMGQDTAPMDHPTQASHQILQSSSTSTEGFFSTSVCLLLGYSETSH